MSIRFFPTLMLVGGITTALGVACSTPPPTDDEACGPRIARAQAMPFDRIEVHGIPAGTGPAVASVSAPGGRDTVLAPIAIPTSGPSIMVVPVHPSFRREGGKVDVQIEGPGLSCASVQLKITALPARPGALQTAVRRLHGVLGEIAAGYDAPLTPDPLESTAPVPLSAIPALWVQPEMKQLEDLAQANRTASDSADLAMLDALAGRLDLSATVTGLRRMVAGVHALVGDLTIDAEAGRRSATRNQRENPAIRFASLTLSPPQEPEASACPTGRENLFQIQEPEKLDNLMRAQDYAARFLAGANDQSGGSASGTVFGDIGQVAGNLEFIPEAGEMAQKIWDSFSKIVLTTAEAYVGLLPSHLDLTAVAEPDQFEEDSEEVGTWTARGVAKSEGLNLTEKVFEKIVETSFRGISYFGDGVGTGVGEEAANHFSKKVAEKAGGTLDETLFKEAPKQAVSAFLKAIGATEGENGIHIPGGCWELPDMSASDPPAGTHSEKPPLVTAHLSGESIELVGEGAGTRHYHPVQAGTTRLELRTVEGYRKATTIVLAKAIDGSMLTTDVMATYAFGGKQFVGATDVDVREIEIDLYPTVKVVKPAEVVSFEAIVHNAIDGGLKFEGGPLGSWSPVQDVTSHDHYVEFTAPENKRLYPIEVRAISTSTSGARGRRDAPVRKATAILQLADRVLDIQPASGCVPPGGELQLRASVLGASQHEVHWHVDSKSRDRIGDDGVLHVARSRTRPKGSTAKLDTITVHATSAEKSDLEAEVDVVVGECGGSWTVRISGGPADGSWSGTDAQATVAANGQLLGFALHSSPQRSCPMVDIRPRRERVPGENVPAMGSVAFLYCDGDFGRLTQGTGYELGNGGSAPDLPSPLTLTTRIEGDRWLVGSFHGQFFQRANGAERNRKDIRATVDGDFRIPIRRLR